MILFLGTSNIFWLTSLNTVFCSLDIFLLIFPDVYFASDSVNLRVDTKTSACDDYLSGFVKILTITSFLFFVSISSVFNTSL